MREGSYGWGGEGEKRGGGTGGKGRGGGIVGGEGNFIEGKGSTGFFKKQRLPHLLSQ